MAEKYKEFYELCERCSQHINGTITGFDASLGANKELTSMVELQKMAILRDVTAMDKYRDKIIDYLTKAGEKSDKQIEYPSYYSSLVDAIFEEKWGYAGLSEWFTDKYAKSPSAKIIGNRIFFFEAGELKCKEQTISDDRRKQLIRAFLSNAEGERHNKDYHELFLKSGERVTIFKEVEATFGLAKAGQESIVIRRPIIDKLSFEEQAERHTISPEMAEWFKNFVKCGFNVIFTGAVRTAKTTMLETWQSYEDGRLEGLMIETTPEIPLHEILPDAPIMQLQVTEDKLQEVIAPVLRSDADYFIMAEARTGMDLWLAVTIASKGSRRSKTTYHTSNPQDICYNVASEICNVVGGNIDYTQSKVSSALDYVIHMVQLNDKSQKRVESIHEIRCDEKTHKPVTVEICHYDKKTDSWLFRNHISQDHIDKAKKEDEDAYYEFAETLKELAEKYPLDKKAEPTLAELIKEGVAV